MPRLLRGDGVAHIPRMRREQRIKARIAEFDVQKGVAARDPIHAAVCGIRKVLLQTVQPF